jgi:hypothetical protein
MVEKLSHSDDALQFVQKPFVNFRQLPDIINGVPSVECLHHTNVTLDLHFFIFKSSKPYEAGTWLSG